MFMNRMAEMKKKRTIMIRKLDEPTLNETSIASYLPDYKKQFEVGKKM
jgi:hypothetical protein